MVTVQAEYLFFQETVVNPEVSTDTDIYPETNHFFPSRVIPDFP